MIYLEDLKLKHIFMLVEYEMMKRFNDTIRIENISTPVEDIDEYDDGIYYHEIFDVAFHVGTSTELEHFQFGWDCEQEAIYFTEDLSSYYKK